MAEKMISKEFTVRQVDVVIAGLDMLAKSYQRRIVADSDPDAKAVWQRKVDEINVLVSKLRS